MKLIIFHLIDEKYGAWRNFKTLKWKVKPKSKPRSLAIESSVPDCLHILPGLHIKPLTWLYNGADFWGQTFKPQEPEQVTRGGESHPNWKAPMRKLKISFLGELFIILPWKPLLKVKGCTTWQFLWQLFQKVSYPVPEMRSHAMSQLFFKCWERCNGFHIKTQHSPYHMINGELRIQTNSVNGCKWWI